MKATHHMIIRMVSLVYSVNYVANEDSENGFTNKDLSMSLKGQFEILVG